MTTPPRHLALIPDGNRRWARRVGCSVRDGHAAGITRVGEITAAAWAAGVEVVTFWWGSPANLTSRSLEEVAGIVGVLEDWLQGPGSALIRTCNADFEVLGRWEELTPSLRAAVEAARSARTVGSAKKLVLLMAYDGRDELRAAAAALGGGGKDTRAFGEALWTGRLPPVDLVLRSGGESHLSAGFMLWHIAEAELAFVDLLWPDVSTDNLQTVFANRAQRRFGR